MRERGRFKFGGSLEISASLQISPHARLRAENIALLSASTKLRERMRADIAPCIYIQWPHNIHDNGLPIHRSIYIGCILIYIFLPPGWLPMHPCTPFLKFRPEPGRAHSMHLMHALDPRWSLQRNSMHPMHPMHPSRPTRTCSPCTPCTPCTNPRPRAACTHAPMHPSMGRMQPMHPCTPCTEAGVRTERQGQQAIANCKRLKRDACVKRGRQGLRSLALQH